MREFTAGYALGAQRRVERGTGAGKTYLATAIKAPSNPAPWPSWSICRPALTVPIGIGRSLPYAASCGTRETPRKLQSLIVKYKGDERRIDVAEFLAITPRDQG